MRNTIFNGVLSLILFLGVVFIIEDKEKLGILLIIYYLCLLRKVKNKKGGRYEKISYQVIEPFNLVKKKFYYI